MTTITNSQPTDVRKLEKEPNRKVAVLIPSADQMSSLSALSLAEMAAFTGASIVAMGAIDLSFHLVKGTYIDIARTTLAKKAIQGGATDLLWLDSDMIYPCDLLLKLIQHNKDIVGVNYTTRRMPIRSVAFKRMDPNHKDHVRLVTGPDSTGLEEVEAIGFGCVLMKTDVFNYVEMPVFQTSFSAPVETPDAGFWEGEDVYFCRKIRAAGLKVYVDHDLSKKIGHVGEFVFRHEHAEAVEEMRRDVGSLIVSSGD